MTPATSQPAKHAYVYSKPACTQCDLTKRWLATNDIPHTVLDITLPAHMELAAELNVQQAPMVILTALHPVPDFPKDVPFASKAKLPSDAIVFSGFQPDLLKRVLLPAEEPTTPSIIAQQEAA